MPRKWTEESVVALIRDSFRGIVASGARDLCDDGAWLPDVAKSSTRVISCDAFQEGNDFLRAISPLKSAGHRVIVQNLSDLAAMGARPVGFVWSLEIPESWLFKDGEWLRGFCKGAAAVCKDQGLAFYGGDLSFSSDRFACTLTIFGDVKGKPLSRQSAGVGDDLFVSRPLGLSSFGLDVLLKSKQQRGTMSVNRFDAFLKRLNENERIAVKFHLWPKAEIALGQNLIGVATSCMDISDGLARDLHRLCRASGVGAQLDSLEEAFHHALSPESAREHAIYGGEEYALLFTAPPKGKSIKGAIRIGTITDEVGVVREQIGSRKVLVKD